MWKIRIVFLVCRLLGFEIPKWSSNYNWQTENNQINLFLIKKKSLTKDQALFPTFRILHSKSFGQARKEKHVYNQS